MSIVNRVIQEIHLLDVSQCHVRQPFLIESSLQYYIKTLQLLHLSLSQVPLQILAYQHHVGAIVNVETLEVSHRVLVYLTLLVPHQTVDQNVQSTRNVAVIWHVLMKNVEILAQDLAEQEHNMVIREILSATVILNLLQFLNQQLQIHAVHHHVVPILNVTTVFVRVFLNIREIHTEVVVQNAS
ncbi:hypothetical protein BDFB_000150 [Asbolus verrucosus]|uniref:Uncharacterized protein n=1 Tax=Asbolus verrucosus TaxID=1661398 RepID=A0A482VV62_ASBVE|nr:hypothetical protein BDFB_000150 [Asbolus verrucosus]